jgi:hypothetical protein
LARYHRRRRNPLALPAGDLFATSAWAVAGGVATRALPEIVMPTSNVGFMGYGLNAVVAVGGSMLLQKFASAKAATGWLVGGTVMLAGRLVSDFFGKTLVTFANPLSGLGYGDPAFHLGLYQPWSFPVPQQTPVPFSYVGQPAGLPAAPGAPVAVPVSVLPSAAASGGAPTGGLPRALGKRPF